MNEWMNEFIKNSLVKNYYKWVIWMGFTVRTHVKHVYTLRTAQSSRIHAQMLGLNLALL